MRPPSGPPPTLPAPGTPGAPPIKKQRATGTPNKDPMLASADEGIARRRAVLQRLQQQRQGQLASQATGITTNDLLSKAAERLGRSSAPARERPPVPAPQEMPLKRTSDIFPTAPKVVTEPRRQLDPDFRRSKSAPPSRPPPPPPPPAPPADDSIVGPVSPPKKPAGRTSPFAAFPQENSNVEVIDEAPTETTPSPIHAAKQQHAGRTPSPDHPPPNDKTWQKRENAGHTPFAKISIDTTVKEDTPENHHHDSGTPATAYGSSRSSNNINNMMPHHAGHTPFPHKNNELAMEDAGHTPYVARTLLVEDDVDTPVLGERSTELKWQERLIALEKEKKQILLQSAEKDHEITRLQRQQTNVTTNSASTTDLYMLLEVADTNGEVAAVSWAREHVQQRSVGFLSPMAGIRSPSRMAGTPQRKRVTPPKPQPLLNTHHDMDTIVEAVHVVQHVYETIDATFVVRKPYGLAEEHDLWFSAGQLSTKQYTKKADIHDYRTLEVAATIKADDSVFVVYGEGTARHQLPDDGTWKEFGNVSEREMSLGSVTYIDTDANEQEYSLDDIFDGADNVRFTYCAAILSNLHGQKQRHDESLVPVSVPASVMNVPNGTPPQSSPKVEAFTQTDIISKPSNQQMAPPSSAPYPAPVKKVAPEPETPGSVEVLSGLFFNGVLSLIWNIIMIPVKVLMSTFYLLAAIFIISLLKLYLSEVDSWTGANFNRPGIV